MAKPQEEKKSTNPIVSIAGTIGGTLIAMLAIIGIFAHDSAGDTMPAVAFAMALLGVCLGYFEYKRSRPTK